MFAVSLSFKVFRILGLAFSGKVVKAWTSEETIVRWGVILKLMAVSLSLGRIIRPSKKVLITFVVIVDSLSWVTEKFLVTIPAFSTTASNRFTLDCNYHSLFSLAY